MNLCFASNVFFGAQKSLQVLKKKMRFSQEALKRKIDVARHHWERVVPPEILAE